MSVDPAEILRQRGYKVTAQRLAVYRVAAERPHLTAEAVVDAVRSDIGAISRRAVYDAVSVLTDMGLLRRIQPAGSAARYEARVADDHHHLVCRSCGDLVDVECKVAESLCTDAGHDSGYDVDEVEVIFWGRCPTCRQVAAGT